MSVRRMFAAVGTSSVVVSSGLLAWQVSDKQTNKCNKHKNTIEKQKHSKNLAKKGIGVWKSFLTIISENAFEMINDKWCKGELSFYRCTM